MRHHHRMIGSLAGAAVAVCAGHGLALPPLFLSVTLDTGSMTGSGVAAPAGALWSELPTAQSSAQGFLADSDSGARLAESFSVTDVGGWTVTDLQLYAYQPGSKAIDQPFTGASVRLWNGQPGASGSTVIAQSTGAPVATFAGLYRADARGLQTRPVFSVRVPIQAQLAPGQYWADWSLSGEYGSGVWSPPSTVPGSTAAPSADALQFLSGVWSPAAEPAATPGVAPTPQRLPLVVLGYVTGSSATCYANCDGSSAAPVLSISDFVCFIQHYAAGSPYANCDLSTSPPMLTVADFTCFLQAYANGCAP